MSNQTKAEEFLDSIQDPITRRIAEFFLQQVFLAVAEKQLPDSEFDLLFYVKVITRAVKDPTMLQQLLSGADLRWGWPDDLQARCDQPAADG